MNQAKAIIRYNTGVFFVEKAQALVKHLFIWENLNVFSLLIKFRYISLTVTSLFYFLGPPYAPFYLKLGVVLLLYLEAYVFIRVYREQRSEILKKSLIIIELTGLLAILLFTGGLDSSFLWYAINPVLLATTLSPEFFCWGASAAFISAAFHLQQYVSGHPDFTVAIWPERAYIVLIFILITLAGQLLLHLIDRLSWQKAIMEKQFEHIKALYGAIDVFSHHGDPQEIANLFTSYCKEMTGAAKAIIWAREAGLQNKQSKVIYAIKGMRKALAEETWYPCIKDMFEDRKNGWKVKFLPMLSGNSKNGGTLVTVRIKSSSNIFGVFSAYFTRRVAGEDEESIKTLVFLADLCAAALEKRYLEAMSEKLLLSEEKDRIARQMHDTVNQNLFGLIHGLNVLNRKFDLPPEGQQQLHLLQKTARRCLQELRVSIYNLSDTKKNKEPFAEEIKAYLQDLEQLNGVRVLFDCQESLNGINSSLRSAIYRIIREAGSNAVRHGICNTITINLQATGDGVKISVCDDGRGFDLQALNDSGRNGLGLINMKELARSHGGDLVVNSRPGEGTSITCLLQWSHQDNSYSLAERSVQ